MSLLPYFFDYDYRPSRLLDQHFGLGISPEDMFSVTFPGFGHPRSQLRSRDYYRPWAVARSGRQDTGSTIVADKDKFQVSLDVQQFAPNEITVKTIGDQIVIEGKHEEKQDEHGYISRHFVRKYALPKGHHADDVVSSLSSDGVLTITAPRKQVAAVEGERVVPIQATGPVHQSVKQGEPKKQEEQQMQE